MDISTKVEVAKNVVTSKFGRQILKAQKNSPEILFAVGIVGVVTSTVMACRATLNFVDVNNETNENLNTANELHESGHLKYSDKDHCKDIAVLHVRRAANAAKLYGPALTVGVLSIGCLRKSHNILNTRNAGLMAAYAMLDKSFDEYRERVLELVGPEKARELRHDTESKEFIEKKKNETKSTHKTVIKEDGKHSVYARLFNERNKNWENRPEYNVMFLRCQQNWLNNMLDSRGHVFLNEAYDALGMERSKAGAVVGWVKDSGGDNCIDFGIFDGSNEDGFYDFIVGREDAILLDFNVDGVIYDKI